MRFHEFKEDKGSTLASRTISRYADEIGPDSMDYDMFKKTAELLDAGKLKSLARHIYYSDTSPAEYVMKVISKKDPETFKKMYGDQDGYFSLMKPRKDLTDDEIEEGHYPHVKSFDKLYGIVDIQQYKHMADDAQSMDMEEFMDTYNSVIDMAGDFWQDHQKTDEEIEEGADFYGYYKDPKYPDKNYMTYPDDMEFKTPHRSNANARQFLSRIGLDPDFENTGSTPIDEFLAATDKYLRMNVSDKDDPFYDEVEMYDMEAKRFKKEHPEITHVGFN